MNPNDKKQPIEKNSFSLESLEKSLAECSLIEKRRQRFQLSETVTRTNYTLLSRGDYNPLLEEDLRKRSCQKELYNKILQLVSIRKRSYSYWKTYSRKREIKKEHSL
jgi:hypothetical protein